jgi:RNA polymerase sigma-70 factor (ECF subfamily)
MTGDSHRGENLAQETFTRVFIKRRNYEPSGKFSTWLWRIALNLCYDELRQRRRRPETFLEDQDAYAPVVLEPVGTAGPMPDASAVARETGELVRAALDRLPENYRTVLVLRHFENLKFCEIADLLEVPEGTVKSRMAEALTRMSRMLKPVLDPVERRAQPTPRLPRETLSL